MVALAACANDSGSSGSGDGDEGGNVAFAMSIGGEPGSLDPLRADDGQADSFGSSVYERLLQRTSDGSGVEPQLAESWELVDDAWVFHLRQDVKFHDGSDMTSADVVASYGRLLAEGGEEVDSTVLSDTVVEAVDDYTVKISRPVPDPTIPARASLVSVVPEEWAPVEDERLASEMMGTGPYKFVSWSRGNEIVLEKFADYWGDEPSIDTVNIKLVSDPGVRLASLQAGEIQLARNMPPDLADQAPKVESGPQSEVAFLRMNTINGGPFTDLAVRQAASLAIDRDTLIENIYQGFGAEAHGQFVGSYVFGFNPDIPSDEFDPERARQLLEESGYDGEPVTLSIASGRWVKDREAGEAIAAMLEDVGFNVKASVVEFSIWIDQAFADATDPDSVDLFIPQSSNQLFDSSLNIPLFYACDGPATSYCDPEVDRRLEEGLVELDEGVRETLYHEVWTRLHDDVAYAAIAETYQVHFLADSVAWTPRADGFIRVQDISLN